MLLTNEQIENIKSEFSQWKDKMYANKTLAERQDFGQFFTPPELTIKMLEKFNDLKGSVLDPTCGASYGARGKHWKLVDGKRVYY